MAQAPGWLSRALPWLAAGLCVLSYLGTLDAYFVYDDYPYVLENPDLNGGLERVPRLFRSSFPAHAPERGLYRPVTAATLLLDRLGGSVEATRYHATNLVLAGALVLAVFGVLVRLTSRPAAVCGTFLFAAHPVHSEAIAWVSGRSELLSAILGCLAFRFALVGAQGRSPAILAAAALLLAGVLAKENAAVVFPLAALILGLDPSLARSRRRSVLVLGALACALVVAGALRWNALGGLAPAAGQRVGPADWLDRLPLIVAAAGEHLRLLVWPHPLSVERMPVPPTSWGDRVVWGGALVLVGWATVAMVSRRSRRLLFLVLWPVVALAPVLHVVPIGETVAERFLLFPSVGLVGFLGVLLWERARSVIGARAVVTIVSGLVLSGLLASAQRARAWGDEETLWREALRYTPRSAAAWTGLGDSFTHWGASEKAIPHYRKALEIDPDLTAARLALAGAYDSVGRRDLALAESREAVQRAPSHAVALNNLGARLAQQGQLEEAGRLYRRALEIAPRYPTALRNAALVALDEGRLEESSDLLRRAKAADPRLVGLAAIEAQIAEARRQTPSRRAGEGR